MNVRERLIKSLDDLDSESVLRLYDMALGFRRKAHETVPVVARRSGMERSRRALEGMRGSLTEEVMGARDDRV